MTINPNNSFEFEDGLSFVDGIWVGSGASSPLGLDAPLNSRYYQTNGSIWEKYGAGINDWRIYTDVDKILTHNKNINGNDPYSYDNVEDEHVSSGAEIVIDNNGNVLRSL
jgi:hypothetical protein